MNQMVVFAEPFSFSEINRTALMETEDDIHLLLLELKDSGIGTEGAISKHHIPWLKPFP